MSEENKIIEETKKEQETTAQPKENSNTQEAENLSQENQINWKKFREERELERKQKKEAERQAAKAAAEAEALKKAMEALVQNEKVSPREEEYQDEDDSERIKREVAKVLKEREQEMEMRRIEQERKELPKKINSVFPDFDRVCTSENLDYFEYHYPEIATAFNHMPDSFDKWQSVYKAVKRLIPNADSKKDEARMEKNLSKPQSASVAGMTATGDVAPSRGLDEQRRKDNWARMQRVMRGVK